MIIEDYEFYFTLDAVDFERKELWRSITLTELRSLEATIEFSGHAEVGFEISPEAFAAALKGHEFGDTQDVFVDEEELDELVPTSLARKLWRAKKVNASEHVSLNKVFDIMEEMLDDVL